MFKFSLLRLSNHVTTSLLLQPRMKNHEHAIFEVCGGVRVQKAIGKYIREIYLDVTTRSYNKNYRTMSELCQA